MTSLTMRRGLRRMRDFLIYGFGALVLLALFLALLFPDNPWLSSLIGLVVGTAMLAVSWFTTQKTARLPEPSVAWIALDYVVKVALTVGVLIAAKRLGSLDVIPVAIIVIASVIITALVQVAAFMPSQRTGGEVASDVDG